jgi:hypothetical protein
MVRILLRLHYIGEMPVSKSGDMNGCAQTDGNTAVVESAKVCADWRDGTGLKAIHGLEFGIS